MKKIIVCSKNKAKNAAVKSVMEKFFKEIELISLDTNSGIDETPSGDEEGILGCYNRIKDAIIQNNNGDLYVAMEGIINNNKYGKFLSGWTVIYDKETQEYYYGCSAKIKIPDEISKNVTKDTRLSKVVADYVGSTDEEVSVLGTNGILTNGEYTRTDEFIDSVRCAIASKYKRQ